ncbi:MAG: hypothetical protein M3R25_06245 [Bacteroidota bacterium]|nr:hypothetical protein [Bacteroidota bacterium]
MTVFKESETLGAGIGLSLGYNSSRYGYDSGDLVFPEDALSGTKSTLIADNKIKAIPFGFVLRYYLAHSDVFIEISPATEIEISNKSHQEIHFGYDPGVVEISDNKDEIYESGNRVGLTLSFGLKPTKSNFGFSCGINYGLSKHKYYYTGWNIRVIKLNGLFTYNF